MVLLESVDSLLDYPCSYRAGSFGGHGVGEGALTPPNPSKGLEARVCNGYRRAPRGSMTPRSDSQTYGHAQGTFLGCRGFRGDPFLGTRE